MAQCIKCGKKAQYGHAVSHAKNRTKRVFLPNIQSKRLMINNRLQKVKICTKCLKRMKKNQKDKEARKKS